MTEDWEQPEPARPVADHSVSQMSEAQFAKLLSAQEKANTATPRLQMALTVLPVVAALAAIAGFAIFITSHFRIMDVRYGVDAAGHHIGGRVDIHALYIAAAVVAGALVVVAGARFDVRERTRTVLMTVGSTVMLVVGACVGVLLDPSRADLQAHYHVGRWGSRASFYALMHTFDALGWLVVACGVAVLVLMFLQRRRLTAAYPADRVMGQ